MDDYPICSIALYSLPSPGKCVKTGIEYDVIATEHLSPFLDSIELGPADNRFVSSHTISVVEFLIIIPYIIDLNKFRHVLVTIMESFPFCGGKRSSSTICQGDGIRFSAVNIQKHKIVSKPPTTCLFDYPVDGELVSLRIVSTPDCIDQISAIAISFDHALCDMTGACLLLSHVLYKYHGGIATGTEKRVGTTSPPSPMSIPPTPHLDRSLQSSIITSSHACTQQVLLSISSAPATESNYINSALQSTTYTATTTTATTATTATVTEPDSDISPPVSSHTTHSPRRKSRRAIPGGVVCLEWTYSSTYVTELKQLSGAHSRHDAVFADVIALLSSAGGLLTNSASLSRDERGRSTLPLEHFGNGTNVVVFDLPPSPVSPVSMPEYVTMLVTSIRNAINSNVGVFDSSQTGVHLTTWWHGFQRLAHFMHEPDSPSGLRFAVGPRCLASAARMCLGRGGQPNVTVLPGSAGGLLIYLIAPLAVAKHVEQQLRQRVRTSKVDDNGSSLGQICDSMRQVSMQPPVPGLPALSINEDIAVNIPNKVDASGLVGNTGSRGVLIWLHGLGSTGASWEGKFSRIDGVRCLHPEASRQPVTAHAGAELNSWFDIHALPVGIMEPSGPPVGLSDSISTVHSIVEMLLADGIPSRQIVIGGFSQGGALAIQAALCCPYQLGAAVSVSGWVVVGDDDCIKIQERNKSIPLFYSCGSADPTISFELSKKSVSLLVDAIGNSVEIQHIPRNKHMPTRAEMDLIGAFLMRILHHY